MSQVPRAVLSDHFTSLLQRKRLVSAVFTTFRFEPQFFETQILPVLLDVPLSHSDPIKLVQLEDALRALPGSIAVYYDQHGLVVDGGAAKLDLRRIPVRHKAIFHPKNVLALVEDVEPDADGHHVRTLLCACASANLTRAGWWENVEVAHVEQINEGDLTFRDDLRDYLNGLLRLARAGRPARDGRHDHAAIDDIREFLKGTKQPSNRSAHGRLRPRMHAGTSSLVDFFNGVARRELQGLNLEIISPYFDALNQSAALDELIQRFEPSEIRVMLPKDQNGVALCSEELHAWVKTRAEWGTLDAEITRRGKSGNATRRRVHAKVYRFFEPRRGGREFVYAGSANLTRPGCLQGGNWESGFLVETTRTGKPDWWLQPDTRTPRAFRACHEEEAAADSGGSALEIRFDWASRIGAVRWNSQRACPPLTITHGGVGVFQVDDVPGGDWCVLADHQSQPLELVLRSTSLLKVSGEGDEPGLVLVQEDGMASRPSLLLDLSAADILKAWSLLSPEQRAEFISQHANVGDEADPMLARLPRSAMETTLFDRFAGIFHAFGSLEERVRKALLDHREREAEYLVFGEKYDSLGSLLKRVADEAHNDDDRRTEHYVVALSARQFLNELARDAPVFWHKHRDRAKRLHERLAEMTHVRDALAQGPGMAEFLDWFDRWFLVRAQPQEVAGD